MNSSARSTVLTPLNCLWALAACAALVAAGPVQAHQLSNVRGGVVPHEHVYKRGSYGQGLTSGHVAPTRNGHDMIIWSPAPTQGFGAPRQSLRNTKPSRPAKPRRASGLTRQIKPVGQGQLRTTRNPGR